MNIKRPKSADLKDADKILETLTGSFSFAMYVRAMRSTLDISQTEMAKKLNLSKGTLCDIEKGRQHVSVALAKKIANKMGFSESLAIQACLQDQLKKAKLNYIVKLID